MQMMVLSFRVARLEVEVEVDLAERLFVRGLRGLRAEGGRLVVMSEERPLVPPLVVAAASLFPTDLVRLREGRVASSSAASCSRQRALTSRARRRGSVAYMSSVFLLSRVNSPPLPSLPACPPSSFASPAASFKRRRRPRLPYLSAVAAVAVSFSGRVSFLRGGAAPGLASTSTFFLRPNVLLRASSLRSKALVRVWACACVSFRASLSRTQGRRSPTVTWALRGVLLGVLFSSVREVGAPGRGVPLGVLPRLLVVLPSLRGEAPEAPLRFSGVLGESEFVLGELRPEEPRGEVGEVRAGVAATRAASLLPGRMAGGRGGGEVVVD